jgi:hypothetical protein|tara:strand:+ start:321 stop:434 length:114 start_codon:yes stop_codon:yes gene_type:complete
MVLTKKNKNSSKNKLKPKQEKSKNGFDPIQYEKPPHH